MQSTQCGLIKISFIYKLWIYEMDVKQWNNGDGLWLIASIVNWSSKLLTKARDLVRN